MQIAHSALSTVGIAGRRVVATGRLDGSSPHARGTLSGALEKLVLLRFIPAYAGNASAPGFRGRPSSVHPRIRGERASTRLMAHTVPGSSPHTRGTLTSVLAGILRVRFIPAYAGNAVRRSSPCSTLTVHPRMRGERLAQRGRTGSLGGSSPHARGTRSDIYNSIMTRRFIPACAGNAVIASYVEVMDSVHPRMRGERAACRFLSNTADGSSPHARGTLPKRQLPVVHAWFIPACAGNALPISY